MRILITLCLLLAAAGFTCWQAETRADLRQRVLLRSLVSQLAPFGVLSYGQTTAHFWGSGSIEDLRFTPEAALLEEHHLPADFALHIPQLRYRDWQHGTGWPATARFVFDTATLPLAEPWPGSAGGTLDWHYRVANGDLQLALTLDAPKAGAVEADLTLKLAEPERLTAATLIKGGLHYRDYGMVQGQRAVLTQRLGADPQNAETALADTLTQWFTARGLPLNSAQRSTLRDFAREPMALTLRLEPPGALRPETLPQFAPTDRVSALGLSLENH